MSRRTLVVCPGRGSYGRGSLGWLAGRGEGAREVVAACDAARADAGRPTVSALDGEASFRASRHLAGEHASLLTFACSLADLADLREAGDDELVAVTGNSMGWYTALVAAGALPLEHGIRLVETMGAYQSEGVVGGQLLWPITTADRRIDPEAVATVDAALAGVGGGAWWSIRLGSHAVVGGTEEALAAVAAALPTVDRGGRTFPVRLPKHAAFHTPLLEPTAVRARRDLADLPLRAPEVPLVDGRGGVWSPRWADPRGLFAYTLGHQVVATYDFVAAVQSAFAHACPDRVVLLGPGQGIRSAVHVALREMNAWSGIVREEAEVSGRALAAFGPG